MFVGQEHYNNKHYNIVFQVCQWETHCSLVAAAVGDEHVGDGDHLEVGHGVVGDVPGVGLGLHQELQRGEVRGRAAGAVNHRAGAEAQLL